MGRLGLIRTAALLFLRRTSVGGCIGYLVVWWAVLAIFTVMWWRQYGRPRFWGLARRATLVAACCAGAFVWLWIDNRVELAVLLHIYRGHGVTIGDLLVIPPLALGAQTVFG